MTRRRNDALILSLYAVFSGFLLVSADFEDQERCHCICPEASKLKISIKNNEDRRIFINSTVIPKNCEAQFVVRHFINTTEEATSPKQLEIFFQRCKCKYQTRNTILLRVIIIFVIFGILSMSLYMFFLLISEQVLKNRSKDASPYQRHLDEPDTISGESCSGITSGNDEQSSDTEADSNGAARARGSSILSKVEAKHHEWNGATEIQRKNVFTDHVMLN